MSKNRPIEILLVEDNQGDVELTRTAFADGAIANRIHAVPDGIEALEFLNRRGAYAAATRPDVILLDVNLPRMDGRELLAILKSDAGLKTIPVVILTSVGGEDLAKTYRLHATCLVNKPADFERYMDVVRAVEEFWLTLARPPRRERGKVA